MPHPSSHYQQVPHLPNGNSITSFIFKTLQYPNSKCPLIALDLRSKDPAPVPYRQTPLCSLLPYPPQVAQIPNLSRSLPSCCSCLEKLSWWLNLAPVFSTPKARQLEEIALLLLASLTFSHDLKPPEGTQNCLAILARCPSESAVSLSETTSSCFFLCLEHLCFLLPPPHPPGWWVNLYSTPLDTVLSSDSNTVILG